MTSLDRDGTIVDTDKSIWFQGRASWMFATLYNTVDTNQDWIEASKSGIDFLSRHGGDATGKLYFLVTKEGKPLRMRRYAYSESFAAIANAAYARAVGDARAAIDAVKFFKAYLHHSFDPGIM